MDTEKSLEDLSAAEPNPCAICHTECCKHYDVIVTGHDIVRLSSALELKPAQFIRIIEMPDENGAIRFGNGWYVLALKKIGDACGFLADDGGLRCMVDSFKPSTCRIYPFQFDGIEITQRQDKLCPSDWMMSSQLGVLWQERLEGHRRENKFHLETVKAWNERVAAKAGLRRFLIPKSVSVAASLSAFLKFAEARVGAATANSDQSVSQTG
jgi:Fe-S-cluster containining protein